MAYSLPGAILNITEDFAGIPNLSIPLVFNQFSPVWGVVNSVQITLNIYANGGELRVDNDSASSATAQVAFGTQVSLTSSDVNLLNGSFQPVIGTLIAATSNSLSLAANDGDVEVGGTSGFSMQGEDYGQITGDSVGNTRTGTINPFFINQFSGDGTFTINVDANQYVQLGSLGGSQQQIDPLSVSGTVMFTFDYTGDGPPPEQPEGGPSTVPEPSTISLFLGSILVTFYLYRNKRRLRLT